MERQTPIVIFMLFITFAYAANKGYTLELDWSATGSTSVSQIGYVTWNQQTLISLTTSNSKGHQNVNLNFNEGPNQLGLYFLGLSGTLSFDNIVLTKDGRSINYILNGDFQMCPLADGQQTHVFTSKIPGWTAPQITIGRISNGDLQVILNAQSRSLTQTISFGKVSKYQFTDSINAAIQSQAKDIITANLHSLSTSTPTIQSMWNTSFLQLNRTFTPPGTPPSVFQGAQGQGITNLTQIIQMVTNATANLLNH